ncbi:MAG: hypothetical protein K0R57_2727 [Paenibacillaceae bacterium]|jgi:sugar phosphate isomerase/epimerase|nr:hypothetical protein [Paenibacillaceae bacterium]
MLQFLLQWEKACSETGKWGADLLWDKPQTVRRRSSAADREHAIRIRSIAERKTAMQLGIGTYTFTWAIGVKGWEQPRRPMGPLELLRTAAQQGIRLVQFADNMPLHELPQPLLKELGQLARQLGITIEVGTRGTDPEHLARYLLLARQLNAGLCRTLITVADMDQAYRDIASVLPDFAGEQVVLAVENHGLHTTSQLKELFRRLDSPYVGSCLDTVNSFGALEAPGQVIRELAPYVVNLHIKDFAIRRVSHMMGYEVLGTPAGEGRLNIPELLRIIRELGRTPTAILELWTPYTNTMEETIRMEREWYARSMDYLTPQLKI